MAPEEVDELQDSDQASVDIPSSDEEMEVEEEDPIADVDEPEIAVEPEEEDEEDEESEDKEDELDEDDEQGSDVDVLSSPPTEAPTPGPSLPPRLRIKLKLPAQNSEASATATPTPDGSSRRRALAKGSDIESEDSDDDDDDSGSTSVATAPGRPLTARQAALRNVVDPLHVSLTEPQNTRKKKQLTEWEMALKREETARKRRNLTEKKLEDEKAETINRLLKKQSRARGKRNALATAEDRSTAGGGQDGYGEDGGDDTGTQTPILPTMYRWISTTKAPTGDEEEPRMVLSFSVPVSVLPQPPAPAPEAMEVDTKPVPRSVPHCDVQGCDSLRKYRLVKDAQRGACGMEHLKALEAQMV